MSAVPDEDRREVAVIRGRQGGRTREMAAHVSARSGLPASVCAGLLALGWTYMEFIDQPSRWESPSPTKTSSTR